ncbi:nuclear pore membrane glycoprotein 210-like [Dermacentor albipictus]|uniref:nuclear pore membrane glycoprotein 210-like n=1 Tax=Dermacentor albipictus TaxID=60249 RepID=UPI0031FCBEDB
MGFVGWVPSYCCVLVLLLSVTEEARLNVPRLLLPHLVEVASNYTLHLVNVDERSCYEWHSSRPEVATVATQGNCSQHATVSAVWGQPRRQTATVLAREMSTGETLRCDVIIDQVASLKMLTTTRVLLLEDSPELLEVQGLTHQGDTFSSIEGMSFDWSLQQQEPVLRFVPVSEWPYELPSPGLLLWESRGYRGWAVLLEGRAAGTARLSVRPLHTAYKHLATQDLELRVVDSVQLDPLAVYLLPGCQACFRLQRLMQGRPPSPVAPSDRYTQRIEDSRVARLTGLCVLAQRLGQTQLLLTNAHLSVDGRQPSAEVHVVKPSYLRFSVTPGDAWMLERHAWYWVQVQLFDEQHHQIHASEGLNVDVHFSPDYFKVEDSTENGTLHFVRTLLSGRTVIRAELVGCRLPDGSLSPATASGEQSVSIQDRLVVQPDEVWLLWEPEEQPVYTVEAHAYEGTGAPVRWQLDQEAPAWATIEGSALGPSATVITRGGPGQVHLVARDSHFTPATVRILIVPVVELEAHGAPALEAELPAGDLKVAIAMHGRDPENQKLRLFDNCSQVPLAIEVLDKGVLKPVPDVVRGGPPVGRGCTSVRVQCQAAGHARLKLSYGTLQSTLLLGCYEPLQAVHPVKSVAVAYGSYKEVAFEGGPRPWPLLPTGHRVQLSPSAADPVTIMRLMDPFHKNKDLHVFRVLCRGLGETDLKLIVGNNASATLLRPATSQNSIRFACSVPASVELRLSSSASCPENKVPSIGGPLEVELVVRDVDGRQLANISSLDVLWELSNHTLAKLANGWDVTSHLDSSAGYRHVVRDFQVLQPQGKTGLLTLTATVLGFNAQVLQQEGLHQHKMQTVSGSLQLELVEAARLSSSSVRMLAHPSHQVNVSILDGSGHFALDGADGIPVAGLTVSHRQLQLHGLREGHVEVHVRDLCLPRAPALPLHVSVVWPGQLRLVLSSPHVQVGAEVEITVHLEDTEGKPLSASLALVDQTVGPLSLRPLEEGRNCRRFAVRGKALGSGTVQFMAKAFPEQLVSAPATIHVFAPLRLEPRNLTLPVGSEFQLVWSGGPINMAVRFDLVEDVPCLSVSPSGLVQARGPPCQGRVQAVAVASGGRDETLVHVVAIKELQLHCPLREIIQGTEVAVHVEALGGLGPEVVCLSAELTRSMRWVASEHGLVSLVAPLTKDAPPDRLCVAHVRALLPGHLELRLQWRNRTAAVLPLEVVPHAKLLVPALAQPESLVLGPGAQLALEVSGEPSLEPNGMAVRLERQPPVLHALLAPGSALLSVRRKSQRRIYLVQVDTVAYALVRPVGGEPWSAVDAPLSLPVGLELLVEVLLYNSLGQRFHATNLTMEAHSSRSDLVSVEEQDGDNCRWKLRVRGAGWTLVHWSVSGSSDAEVLLPLSSVAKDDLASLLVGERFWLQGPFAAGHWVAEHGPLRITSAAPGCALAHMVLPGGRGLALWTGSPQGQLRRALEAQPPTRVHLEIPSLLKQEGMPLLLPTGQERLLFVHFNGRTSSIHGEPCTTVLTLEEQEDYDSPFTCWVRHKNGTDATPDLLEVSAGFSLAYGGHWCRVRSVAEPVELELPLLVGVSLPAKGGESEPVPLSLVAPIQLVRVEAVGSLVQLVYLAGPSVASMVQIRRPDGVQIAPHKAPEQIGETSHWKMTLRAPSHTSWLALESPSTGQRLRVPLEKYSLGHESAWSNWLQNILFVVAAAAGGFYYVFYYQRAPAERPLGATAASPPPNIMTAALRSHDHPQRSPSGVLPYIGQTEPVRLWSRLDSSNSWSAPRTPSEQPSTT